MSAAPAAKTPENRTACEKEKPKVRVAVLGAGPAGITAAYCLSKNSGYSVTVYESLAHVGGMATTINLWGQKVDLGPHRFFSSDPRVNKLWKEVVGKDYSLVRRLTRIYFEGRFFFYPLRMGNVLRRLGVFRALVCVGSYVRAKLVRPSEQGTFETWVVSRFGRKLFNMFFKTYSEKLWGIPCGELDADFAAQRIKKLSFWEAVKGALRVGKRNAHKTLVDEFAYPHGGSGVPYERMAAFVAESGNAVLTQNRVAGLWTDGDRKVLGIVLPDGRKVPYDHVISSMPLTDLVSSIAEAPLKVAAACAQLRFRNTILVYLHVRGGDYFEDQWLYIHDPGVAAGRITNFSNWVPQILGDSENTVIVLEYWCNPDDPDWAAGKEELVARATADLAISRLIPRDRIIEGTVIKVPKCYPVYHFGYRRHLKIIEEFLRSVSGLQAIGRYGSFKYNNQDHSILMGLLAAENLSSNHKNDLWGINTDYEYQEKEKLSSVGLSQPRP